MSGPRMVSVKIHALKFASAVVGVAGVATFRAPAAELTLLDRAVWLWIKRHPDSTVEDVMGGVKLSYLRALESLGRLRTGGRVTAVVPERDTHLRYAVAVPLVPPGGRDRSPFLPRSDRESSDG